jgi:predicted transposase/invertase (TIGR01784 family)
MNNDKIVEILNKVNEIVDYAIENGIKQGIEKGIKQGMEKGIAQGIEQGIEQGKVLSKIEVAKSMKDDGVDFAKISKYTGVPVEEIIKL